MARMIRIASLFSGCGGMDLGMLGGFNYLGKKYRKLPARIVYAADIDPSCCEIYNLNFKEKCQTSNIKDVIKDDIPDHDILCGGFPCQSFSIVAQNPQRLGYKDEKGKLFFEMRDILLAKRPLAFVAENVKGILSANQRQAFPLIIESFEKAGYFTVHSVLNASDYGVPQKRERVFIVGFRVFEDFQRFRFPKPVTPEEKVSLGKILIPEEEIPQKYYFSERALGGLKRANKGMNKGRAQNLSLPCNTVSAHLSKVSLNSTDPVLLTKGGYRRFTPREAARIQSFPESFLFTGSDGKQYHSIGNAVPPVLMWYLAKEIYRALGK